MNRHRKPIDWFNFFVWLGQAGFPFWFGCWAISRGSSDGLLIGVFYILVSIGITLYAWGAI